MPGKRQKKRTEPYLKIPNHILSLAKLRSLDKMLLAHFYSFGSRGCWQSNATLAKIFMVSPATITRSIALLRNAQLVGISSPKGRYRTIWASTHPDVRAARQGHRRKTCRDVNQNDEHVNQNAHVKLSKTAVRVSHRCSTTNNITITENNNRTTATPPPLPAGGQASALLDDRKGRRLAGLEALKRRLKLARAPRTVMSAEEFEQRRQKQMQALLAGSTLPGTSASNG